MENLLSMKDIMDRYQCKEKVARRIMTEMGLLKRRPMMVRESEAKAWEEKQTEANRPREEKPIKRTRSRKSSVLTLFPPAPEPKPGQLISRVRPASMKTG